MQELVCDWQQAASNVLVALGKRFVGKVMEEMLSKFQPGILPHYFVVQTLANLSVSNGRWRPAPSTRALSGPEDLRAALAPRFLVCRAP